MTGVNGLKSFSTFASETQGFYDDQYKDSVNYMRGYEPLESLPATWYNSLMHDLTQQAQATKNIVDSIYAELVTVIENAGIELDVTKTNQLLSAINKVTELQIATGTVLGGIYSSLNEWYVSVQSDGTAKVNTVVATTEKLGLVQPSGSITVTSAGAIDVQTATTAKLGVVKTSGNITNTNGTIDVQTATTAKLGVVQPSGSITVTSAGAIDVQTATTAKLGVVKTSGNITNTNGTIDVRSASTAQTGVVQLSDAYNETSQTKAVTEKALSDGLATKQASGNYKTAQTAVSDPSADGTTISFIDTISQDTNGVITATKKTVRTGTTAQTGVVQLEDSTSSTSTTTAATPNSVKQAYDRSADCVTNCTIADNVLTFTRKNGTTFTVDLPAQSNVATYAKYLVNSDNPSGTDYVTADTSKNLSAHTLLLE